MGVLEVNKNDLEERRPLFFGPENIKFRSEFRENCNTILSDPQIQHKIWSFGNNFCSCYKQEMIVAVNTVEGRGLNKALEKLILLDSIEELNIEKVVVDHLTEISFERTLATFKAHRKVDPILVPSETETIYLLKVEGYIEEEHILKKDPAARSYGYTLDIIHPRPALVLDFLLQGLDTGYTYSRSETLAVRDIVFQPFRQNGDMQFTVRARVDTT